MPALTNTEGPILITGATGYIGTWILSTLLTRGINVHATIRTLSKGDHLLTIFKEYEKQLKLIVVGDISLPNAFDEAVRGVSGIIHTASPVGQFEGEPSEVIKPAVKGVTELLDSVLRCNKNCLKRIIILSSCAAIAHSSPTSLLTVSEKDWNDDPVRICKEKGADASGIEKYIASKVVSERAAWEWFSHHQSQISWDLCVLCPPWVFGPAIHEVSDITTINPSFKILHSALAKAEFAGFNGDDPARVPGHGWVDVRDIAEVCVKALELEGAGGERIIVCEGRESPFVWGDWVGAVEDGGASDDFVDTNGKLIGERSCGVHFDTSKEKRIFGMKWRNMGETGRDLLACFQEKGWN